MPDAAAPDTPTLSVSTAPVVPTAGVTAVLRPLPSGAELTGGFWADRIAANGTAIPLGRARLDEAGNIENLRIAGGAAEGEALGPVFADSDVYKWLEALAWEYGRTGDPALLTQLDEVTAIVAAAQRPDGYLNSVVELRRRPRYDGLGWSHELYCAGHLMQAAVAAARATGRRELLGVAERLAAHLAGTFGPGGRPEVDGHPVVEMALVELYRLTGTRRHLDLAAYFVTARGHGHATPGDADPTYFSDRVPVRDADDVEGHAVRAVYLGAGATDVAVETGDEELLAAVRRQFAAMVRRKQYVTGGVGSRWEGEAFGDPYELPTDRAYAETCAAIGLVQWAWRLLLATGDPAYADQVEHTLYNAVLPGVSLAGTEYFYANPLQLRTGARADDNRSPAHGRRGWYDCACCPPNVMRTLASLPSQLATTTADGLQVQLYAPAVLRADVGGELAVELATAYPWDGRVEVTVHAAPPRDVEVALRVPAWAQGATLDGRAVPAGDYARVRRTFAVGDRLVLELPTPARLLVADDRVDSVRGCVAIARGPLVYAAEQPDQADGAAVDDLRVDPLAPIIATHRPGLLGGVTVLETRGGVVRRRDGRTPYRRYARPHPPVEPVDLTLVPYYAWANRGPRPMRVWLPTM
ncbi:MAG TPA: beta-L-arabinofuranosidase domain-containing protein [Streptosporangiales bacterium]